MSTIKISEEHLTTLLRRAELHSDATKVTVSMEHYRSLVKAFNEYEALKKGLTVAGVGTEHLQTLLHSQLEAPSPIKSVEFVGQVASSPEKIRWSANAPVFVPKSTFFPRRQHDLKASSQSTSPSPSIASSPPTRTTATPVNVPQKDMDADYESAAQIADGWYEEDIPEYFEDDRQDRTVMILGLSPFTTLEDLVGIIRGGIILNMYIRPRDRTGLVSFVEPMAAEKFIMHSRRNDIYLKGKRLEVAWAESSSFLPGYIQRQVQNNGATRNIVIRFAKTDMTEKTIREDLEHIHRLEVVNVVTTDNHIFISLNGIQWAITARHCMQSRLKYKGTRIEFFEDECDQVLPVIRERIWKKKEQENFKRPATVSMANRFALLFDSEDSANDLSHAGRSTKRSASHEAKPPA